MPSPLRMRDERGFTLIEVMVTMLILVVGITGAIALIDGANARTLATKDREAGNALTREVIEAARSVPYRQLGGTSLKTSLQAIPGLEDSTPSTVAWTIERRKQTYTVNLSVCSIDDDQDGFGNTAGGGFCVATNGTADRNPDDYKRLAVNLSWTRRGVTRNIKQTGVINNEASSAGPDIEFTSQPSNPVTDPTLSNLKFGVKAADSAVVLRFAVDGVELDSATNTTTALFAWDIDSGGRHVPDGTYVVSVTAFDVADTPGPTRSLTIRLNRDAPLAPQDVFGGWNPRIGFTDANDIVEIQWARNDEPDIKGYRVYRGASPASATLVPGCDFTGDPSATECRDLSPPAGATIDYFVRALDEDPTDGSLREGDPSTPPLTAIRASTQPNQPPTLTATVDGEDVVLNWDPATAATPPYTGDAVIFYRVYRDGKALGDRIARTSQDMLTSFRDSSGATASHTYYVTSVDENFSESAPLGPVSAP